jgi:hypothetical protein
MFAGPEGNILLEDVQPGPGQFLFLNVSKILGEPFIFHIPDTSNLQEDLRLFADDVPTFKDIVITHYSKLRKEVLEGRIVQLAEMSAQSAAEFNQFALLCRKCERLAVFRQLCFGEPIPLIDMNKLAEEGSGKGGESR